MNKIKKLTAVLVCMAMLCAVLPCVTVGAEEVASGECGDNLTWALDSEGVLTISGTGDMTDWEYLSEVPWYSNRSSIKTVVIENGVTSIGDYAFFGCESLTSVTIPDSVTSIGSSAFYGCESLTSVTIPNSVMSIGGRAFLGCSSLMSVTIPDSVTSIGSSAFYGCESLTSVTIPDSVTTIGGGAFRGCSSLTSVTIPDSVTSIGENAFRECTGLTSITIPDSVTSIGSSAFYGCESLTSVTVPDSVTTIGGDAFGGCTGLTSVSIGSGVTSVADYAFYHCTGLTSVTIPDSVTTIGEYAFWGCSSLTSVMIGNSVTSIGENAFRECTGLMSVTIPDSVTSIGNSAFYGCESLTSVTISDSVTSIGRLAFSGCTGLTNVTIPDSVTSIGSSAFYGCESLTSVTIPDSVTSIGEYAFYECIGLTSIEVDSVNTSYASVDGVLFDKEITELIQYPANKADIEYTIPDSVTSIGRSAFIDCRSLTSVTIPDSVTSIGDYAFEYCAGLTSVTIGNSVASIGMGAFYYCTGLTNIIIPIGVMSISVSAFRYCTGLTSVTIPDSVTSIGSYAFYYCDSLTDVYYSGSEEDWNAISVNGYNDCLTSATIHYSETGSEPTTEIVASGECGDNLTWTLDSDGVLTISGTGDMTEWEYSEYSSDVPWYGNRSSIKTVVIESGVTTIGDYAFFGCEWLRRVTIPDSVTSIGRGAFYGTAYYKDEANWSGDVLYIGNYLIGAEFTLTDNYTVKDGTVCIAGSAFSGCENLTSVTIPAGVTNIGHSAFWSCSSLTSVTIPDSVTSIGAGAFGECYELKSITIPTSVTEIGESVFLACGSLTSIIIPDSVTSIGSGAFECCTGLTSITIPDSVTSIGYQAFCDCSGLTSITIPDSVTEIGLGAFEWCDSLTDVYYGGSEEDWSAIGIDDENECLTSATIHYNSTPHEPTTEIVASGECGDNLTWTLDSEGVLTISGTGAMTDWGWNGSPWYSSGKIKSVIIESGVTNIADYAFRECTGLTSVNIPDSVTSIGYQAFYGCSSLTSVNIPASVTSIGYDAFYDTAYYNDEANWENGVLYIDNALIEADSDVSGDYQIKEGTICIADYAFCECYDLTSVTIPNSVMSIGSRAFYSCESLTSVTIPASVTSIGKMAFFDCESLTRIEVSKNNPCYTSTNGILFTKDMSELMLYPNGKTNTRYEIPDGVTSIGEYAFYKTGLIRVSIPNGVTSIGESAFYYSAIQSVTIPISVTEIDEDAFGLCVSSGYDSSFSGLTNVYYEGNEEQWNAINIGSGNEPLKETTIHYNSSEPSAAEIIASGEIGDNITWTLTYGGTLTISGIGNVDVLDDDVPYYSRKRTINTAVIENGVTGIYGNVFDCNNLTSVTIPDSVTIIGTSAFEGCESLASITIPDSVTTIGEVAFYGCKSLISVTIPNSVTSIGFDAFDGCTSLTDVYYSGSEEEWNTISIDEYNECLTNATIHYNSTGPVPEITDVKLTPETDEETGAEVITVTVETEDIFESNSLIAVGYGDNGAVSVSSVENGEATLPAEGVTTVKVFCWESLESMIPLCEAKTVTVTAQ